MHYLKISEFNNLKVQDFYKCPNLVKMTVHEFFFLSLPSYYSPPGGDRQLQCSISSSSSFRQNLRKWEALAEMGKLSYPAGFPFLQVSRQLLPSLPGRSEKLAGSWPLKDCSS